GGFRAQRVVGFRVFHRVWLCLAVVGIAYGHDRRGRGHIVTSVRSGRGAATGAMVIEKESACVSDSKPCFFPLWRPWLSSRFPRPRPPRRPRRAERAATHPLCR